MAKFHGEILERAFPKEVWPLLVSLTHNGVLLADELISSTPLLNWKVGRDQRGYLRRVGVMYCLAEACRRGDLPFECEEKENTAKNSHLVEIVAKNVYAHIVQVEHPGSMPKDVPLRINERESNQLHLFERSAHVTPFDTERRWYGWYTFGAGEDGLSHVCIGLPEWKENDWLYRINLTQEVRNMPSLVGIPPEKPTEVVLRLRNHIEESSRRQQDITEEKKMEG